MSGHVQLLVDDDVLVAELAEGLAKAGLRISNIPGADNTLRVHRATPLPNVTSLAYRQQHDRNVTSIVDGIRNGRYDLREDGPGAA